MRSEAAVRVRGRSCPPKKKKASATASHLVRLHLAVTPWKLCLHIVCRVCSRILLTIVLYIIQEISGAGLEPHQHSAQLGGTARASRIFIEF